MMAMNPPYALPHRERSRANPWIVAVVVTIPAFMEILDTTIVNVALPHIAGSLGSTYDDASWVMTSYLVANGIILMMSTSLAKKFGRTRYFVASVAMFIIMSLLCGLSTSLPMLICFRVLQGVFGGGLQPCQQAIILDTFPPEKRAAAFSLTSIATVVSPVLGPIFGGYLTDNFSWRWIFFVNIPFGVLAIWWIILLVEDRPGIKAKIARLDIIGMSLVTLGFGCLEVMFDRAEDDDWFSSSFICLMGTAGLVGIVGSVFWMKRATNPLLNLDVFKDRNFSISTILIAMLGALLYASTAVVPQFAQLILGYPATLAGWLLVPGGIVILFLIPIVIILMRFVQARYLIALGFSLMGVAMWNAAHLSPDIDFIHLMYFRMFQTSGLAFLFVPISSVAYATLPAKLNLDAASVFSMARNYAGSIAISLAIADVTEEKQSRMAQLVKWMTPYREEYREYLFRAEAFARARGVVDKAADAYAHTVLYRELGKQSAVLAFNDAFMLLSVGSFCVVPLCFMLVPRTKNA